MRNKIILIIIFLLPIVANSNTIHWIIFADTHDSDNGTEIINSVAALKSQFINRINDAIEAKGYISNLCVYSGTDFSEEKCKQIINSLSCKSDDIIVFYYLGHGGRADTKDVAAYSRKHPWPDLQFNDAYKEKEFTSLQSIHELLKKKFVRLVVTFGMCCNHQASFYKKHGLSSQSHKFKLVGKRFAKKVGQKLFLRYQGDILISSASPGEYSYGGYKYGGVDVDCYTASLCQVLDRYANNDFGNEVSWNSFLYDISSRCSINVLSVQDPNDNDNGKQTPKYAINVQLKY